MQAPPVGHPGSRLSDSAHKEGIAPVRPLVPGGWVGLGWGAGGVGSVAVAPFVSVARVALRRSIPRLRYMHPVGDEEVDSWCHLYGAVGP